MKYFQGKQICIWKIETYICLSVTIVTQYLFFGAELSIFLI